VEQAQLVSTLKMRALGSSAALATIYQTKNCHITEEHNVNNQCHDNLQSHIWHHKATLNIKISSWQWEKDAKDVGMTCQYSFYCISIKNKLQLNEEWMTLHYSI